jgi:hypothetical protein
MGLRVVVIVLLASLMILALRLVPALEVQSQITRLTNRHTVKFHTVGSGISRMVVGLQTVDTFTNVVSKIVAEIIRHTSMYFVRKNNPRLNPFKDINANHNHLAGSLSGIEGSVQNECHSVSLCTNIALCSEGIEDSVRNKSHSVALYTNIALSAEGQNSVVENIGQSSPVVTNNVSTFAGETCIDGIGLGSLIDKTQHTTLNGVNENELFTTIVD